MNKQSSIDWFQEQIIQIVNGTCELTEIQIFEQAKAMHKEEVKIIIEHYHNNMFYLKLTEKELKNITEIIYDKIFGGQDNE
jgi:hypothetical protein